MIIRLLSLTLRFVHDSPDDRDKSYKGNYRSHFDTHWAEDIRIKLRVG